MFQNSAITYRESDNSAYREDMVAIAFDLKYVNSPMSRMEI